MGSAAQERLDTMSCMLKPHVEMKRLAVGKTGLMTYLAEVKVVRFVLDSTTEVKYDQSRKKGRKYLPGGLFNDLAFFQRRGRHGWCIVSSEFSGHRRKKECNLSEYFNMYTPAAIHLARLKCM